MTHSKEVMDLLYWQSNPEWYTYSEPYGMDGFKIKPDAPIEAKKSFEKWSAQRWT